MDIPKYLYHATMQKFIPSICSKGLMPGNITGTTLWDSWIDKEDKLIGSLDNYIYFHYDIGSALEQEVGTLYLFKKKTGRPASAFMNIGLKRHFKLQEEVDRNPELTTVICRVSSKDLLKHGCRVDYDPEDDESFVVECENNILPPELIRYRTFEKGVSMYETRGWKKCVV